MITPVAMGRVTSNATVLDVTAGVVVDAVILVLPAATPVATPAESIVAAATLLEFQVTKLAVVAAELVAAELQVAADALESAEPAGILLLLLRLVAVISTSVGHF